MHGRPDSNIRLRLVLLTLGAVIGLILAVSGLVQRWSMPSQSLPGSAVARVGDRLISRERYQQVLNDLGADKRTHLSSADRQFALDRLIDEELLILRGIELGLAETSPEIRKAIARTVIAQIVTEAEASVPGETDLRDLYESDPGFFTQNSRYRVHWWRLDGQGESFLQNTLDTYEQLGTGAEIALELQTLGFNRDLDLPDSLLPFGKLVDYLGPELANETGDLQPGQYSHPIASNQTLHILHLVEFKAGYLPPFDQLRPVLETEYKRRTADQAIRNYLQWLRRQTEIDISEISH